MRNIGLAFLVIIVCVAIGSALENPGGGFIVGVVLIIMLGKQLWKGDANESASHSH